MRTYLQFNLRKFGSQETVRKSKKENLAILWECIPCKWLLNKVRYLNSSISINLPHGVCVSHDIIIIFMYICSTPNTILGLMQHMILTKSKALQWFFIQESWKTTKEFMY